MITQKQVTEALEAELKAAQAYEAVLRNPLATSTAMEEAFEKLQHAAERSARLRLEFQTQGQRKQ